MNVVYNYIKMKQYWDFLTFDFNLVTAADYTVELKISEKAYQTWKKLYYQESNLLSECTQLEIYLKQELEKRVEMCDDLAFEDKDMPNSDKCRISKISMAYNNEEVIEMLKKRGQLLKAQKY